MLIIPKKLVLSIWELGKHKKSSAIIPAFRCVKGNSHTIREENCFYPVLNGVREYSIIISSVNNAIFLLLLAVAILNFPVTTRILCLVLPSPLQRCYESYCFTCHAYSLDMARRAHQFPEFYSSMKTAWRFARYLIPINEYPNKLTEGCCD